MSKRKESGIDENTYEHSSDSIFSSAVINRSSLKGAIFDDACKNYTLECVYSESDIIRERERIDALACQKNQEVAQRHGLDVNISNIWKIREKDSKNDVSMCDPTVEDNQHEDKDEGANSTHKNVSDEEDEDAADLAALMEQLMTSRDLVQPVLYSSVVPTWTVRETPLVQPDESFMGCVKCADLQWFPKNRPVLYCESKGNVCLQHWVCGECYGDKSVVCWSERFPAGHRPIFANVTRKKSTVRR